MSARFPSLSQRARALLLTLAATGLLAGCERPPMQSSQTGYRGTGMQQVNNPRIAAAQRAALPEVPVLPPPATTEGPKAKDVYQNVKVLGELSVSEFTRHMLAITQWVSPTEGCTYCHNPANLADDSKYTKVVARRMIEMTRQVNTSWGQHVGSTGVTCYTCHRGAPVPANVFYTAATPKNNRVGPGLGDDAGQNKANPSIALASLPYDPFTPFLTGGKAGAEEIRVQGTQALPQDDHRSSIKQAEYTYSLMNHFSKSLGVNCTFCHNTQSFQNWDGPEQRVTAWHGIRMARTLNNEYLTPLTSTFPAHRLGATGDVAKVQCATCHQGVNKPLGGLAMAKDYAGLLKTVATAPAAAPQPAAATPDPFKAVMYFAVGSPTLTGEQAKNMEALIANMVAQPATSATISGYHSAAGTLAQNQALAKARAINVRDALIAGGVADSRIKLEKPQQTEANSAGEDATARRVEVTVR
jgi:photosynthetic reaction center cytochrome c subunit